MINSEHCSNGEFTNKKLLDRRKRILNQYSTSRGINLKKPSNLQLSIRKHLFSQKCGQSVKSDSIYSLEDKVLMPFQDFVAKRVMLGKKKSSSCSSIQIMDNVNLFDTVRVDEK